MNVPHGAWTRVGVRIGDGTWFETQRVIWLQAGPCYADLRVPFHAEADHRCFTGTSAWEGDLYRWTHRLDLERVADQDPPSADDVGRLEWDGTTLIERGLFPTAQGPVAYEERWIRLAGPQSPIFAAESDIGCLIRVGDHAVAVIDGRAEGGAFSAAHFLHQKGTWRDVGGIGDPTPLPDPDAPPPGWSVTAHAEMVRS